MTDLRKSLMLETAFNSYKAVRIVGRGGSGTVYEVRDESGERWAAKVLGPGRVPREKAKRFKNEIQFCARNEHAGILTVVDHGVAKLGDVSTPFYVMQLFDESLRQRIETGLSPEKALAWLAQILDGVEAAHLQHVIHRDLKPENILLDAASSRLVVADFGIASFQEEELYTAVETKDTSRLANFVYSAPEQRARGRACAYSTDIYALGLILNEMITGEVPQGTDYRLIETVDPSLAYLDELVEEMLRQSQEERIQTIEGVKQALIGHRNDFITRQRLSELRGTVVPTTEIDDPLVSDPVRLVDFDWEQNTLTLFLSRPVNEKWFWALNNMGSYGSVMGHGPETFSIHRERATAAVDERNVERVIGYFKAWIPLANKIYRERIERERKDEEERQRQALRERVEREEARARIRRNVRL
jgi:serine/threonine protein kinase